MVSFNQTSVTIGRSRSCDHRLEDNKQVVSGKHACVSFDGHKLCVTDLGSRNFTYLDGQQLEPNTAYEMTPGATISIAEFEIQAVSAADLEPERDLLAWAVTEVPVTLGWRIVQSPGGDEPADLETVAQADVHLLLLGSDIRAPIGQEWIAARRAGQIFCWHLV